METTVRTNNRYQILTPSGWSDFVGIKKQTPQRLLRLSNGQESITCTPSHGLKLSNGEFKEAIHVTLWDELESLESSVLSGFDITCVESESIYDPIFVHEGHEYFSGSLVSHNCMQFLGSSGTLIAGWKLKEMTWETPIHDDLHGFKKYREPEAGHQYAMCADVSEGKGFDYSTFQLIDVTAMPYQQVATFRSNMIGGPDFAHQCWMYARQYNEACILVEVNIALGPEVASIIHQDLEYEHVLFTTNAGARGKKLSSGFSATTDMGLKSSKTTKATGCSILKLLLESNQLILRDHNTYQELTTFSRDTKKSFSAEAGCHDDSVMALVLFAWLSTQNYFSHMTDLNTLSRLREKTDDEMMNELMPVGFFGDEMGGSGESLQERMEAWMNQQPGTWTIS